MSILSKIPNWKATHLIKRINGRARHYQNTPENKKKLSTNHRTWYQCYKNNRDKVIYWQGTYCVRNKRKPFNPWDGLISSQIAKFERLYDPYQLWRKREFEQLEKLNTGDVFAVAPSPLWQFVASLNVSKVNKAGERRLSIESSGSWKSTIDAAKNRFGRGNSESSSEWTLLVRQNVKKLSTLASKNGWSAVLGENIAKL